MKRHPARESSPPFRDVVPLMTRTRIQIGQGGMLYLMVAALLLGAAIYTQANLLFWSFGLMIGGLLISMILSLFALRKLTIQRLLPGHGVVGEAMVIRYRLANRRRIMPGFNLIIRETWGKGRRGIRTSGPLAEAPQRLASQPTGWVLHLGPGQIVQAEAMCWPLKRGMLRFEHIEVSTTFPFGVIRKTLHLYQTDEVLIYPRLYRMNRRLLSSMTQIDLTGRKQLDRGGGTEEFFGLRPYRVGDSIKTIDWKHSARTGSLISREFTQPSPPKIMLLLDLTPPPVNPSKEPATDRSPQITRKSLRKRKPTPTRPDPNDPVERAITLAASLICDAYFYGYQIGLMVRGGRCNAFPLHHSLPHRAKMLEALSTIDTTLPENDDGPPMTDPSVIIHCGQSQQIKGEKRCMILGAAQLEQFVREVRGGISELLTRRTAAVNRRDDLAMQQQARRESETELRS